MKKYKCQNIYISIINGFLGSGKSTFLKGYIEELLKENENIIVIMNEYGDFDIDSNGLETDIEIKSLINGCICCDLNLDLINQIKKIIEEKQSTHIINRSYWSS